MADNENPEIEEDATAEEPAAPAEAEAEAGDVEAEAPAEEPVVEEPAAEEPAADEVVAEEPAAEEPAADEPAAAAKEPAAAEPEKTKRASRAKKDEEPEEAPAPKKRTPRAKPLKKAPVAKERGTYTREPRGPREEGRRKERRGVVVSDRGDKTIAVRIDSAKPHPKYKKIVRRSSKLYAHDEKNEAKVGDVVRVVECRPLSAMKRWRLIEIVTVGEGH